MVHMYTPEMLKVIGRTHRLQQEVQRRAESAVLLIVFALGIFLTQHWLPSDQFNVLPIAGIVMLAAGAVGLSSWKVGLQYLSARREARSIVREFGYPVVFGTQPGL